MTDPRQYGRACAPSQANVTCVNSGLERNLIGAKPFKFRRTCAGRTKAPPNLNTMKSALFFAAIIVSSLTGILATPARRSTVEDGFAVPSQHESDLEKSVDGISSPEPESKFVDAAAATQYWVCIAVSPSTGKYGWSQGGSESSALGKAKSKCGKKDCSTFYSCQEYGCVGIDYGSKYVALSRAYGYGSKDGSKAAGKALSVCKSHTHGCKKPGHFCAKRII